MTQSNIGRSVTTILASTAIATRAIARSMEQHNSAKQQKNSRKQGILGGHYGNKQK